MDSKPMIDPRTKTGRLTLRYRGLPTSLLLKELGLDPEDKGREYRTRDDLIAELVAMKLAA
ncbi:hypothetical protein DVA43_07155 [Leclercia sp. W6]|nr:hypothetical protein DVA43_07155 [Leclercia sp. W6]